MGCKVGSMPFVYLGLPLGAPNKNTSMWDGVEEKMRRRVARWKRQYISKGGRLILIKSTMASMPLYQMSLFRMPKSVARRLEKLQRDFLWGGGNLERYGSLYCCTSFGLFGRKKIGLLLRGRGGDRYSEIKKFFCL